MLSSGGTKVSAAGLLVQSEEDEEVRTSECRCDDRMLMSLIELQEYIGDAEEEIRRAQLLDTVLLSALVNCSPSRRGAVVELLAGPNRCQIESCSVLLASQGNSYTEALLWLFRSQNQHNRVLQALTEEKCVGIGE